MRMSMKNLFRCLCLGWLVVCGLLQSITAAEEVPQAILQIEQQRIEAIGRALAAAVCIFSGDGQGGGSGVVISSDGYVLTNFHVAQPCGSFLKCGMSDGRMYEGVLVGLDPTGDVALVKLNGRNDFPVAEMG